MKLVDLPVWIIVQPIWWKSVAGTTHIPRRDTTTARRSECIAAFVTKRSQLKSTTWRQFYTKGYRCVRVTLEVQG